MDIKLTRELLLNVSHNWRKQDTGGMIYQLPDTYF